MGSLHLQDLVADRELEAIGPADHGDLPAAADLGVDVDPLERRMPAVRAIPLRDLGGIGPGPEDGLWRGGEAPGEADGSLGVERARCRSSVSGLLLAPRGGRRADPCGAPMCGSAPGASSAASFSGSGWRRLGRHWASLPRSMRPARSSTLRWREIAGRLTGNGAASSFTVASPSARRARIDRRMGSARAAKVRSSWSAGI